jgi:uridine kinase
MQGDILVIQEWHSRSAREIAEILIPYIKAEGGKYTISVAGESGAGKSEIASVLADSIMEKGIPSIILQQDDYFVYPPKTNAEMRQKDIGHVGLSEVRLELIDQHLDHFITGKHEIEKPLVIFKEDRITSETVSLKDIQVVIVEGTYTTSLKNIYKRVFIDRTYEDTREARKLRAREKQYDLLEKILSIEHKIISAHKSMADIIVTKDYQVEQIKE